MEITKEKYDEIMKRLKNQEENAKSHEEDIETLKVVLREEIEQAKEFSDHVVETINIMMLDNANIVSILLAILEAASKNKSLDIADIKQIFILNIEQNKNLFDTFPNDLASMVTKKYVEFFDILEKDQEISNKIKVKNIKTSGNTSSKTTKKIMNKDYENMKNDNAKPADENTDTNTNEAKKSSNIIHINFKGDKD